MPISNKLWIPATAGRGDFDSCHNVHGWEISRAGTMLCEQRRYLLRATIILMPESKNLKIQYLYKNSIVIIF